MKKIVSSTIVVALATNIAAIPVEKVSALENDSVITNIDNTEKEKESVDVTVENTEKIGGGDVTLDNTNDLQEETVQEETVQEETVQEETLQEDNIIIDEATKENELDKTVEINNKEETIELEPQESIKEAEKNSENLELEQNNKVRKIYGSLELDINFPMPIINSDKIDMKVNISNSEGSIGEISVGGEAEGVLKNGLTYKIEKLNSKRQPLEVGQDDIYFVHITIENMERGVYSTEIIGGGYLSTQIDNIEIIDYSKRVKLGSRSNTISINGKDESYAGSFLVGDVNLDNKIDQGDYELVFKNIGIYNAKYDLNKDGYVDISDLTYVNENIGKTKEVAEVINANSIIDPNNVNINLESIDLKDGSDIKDLLSDAGSLVSLGKKDGQAPTIESPLVIAMDLSKPNARGESHIEMEQVVIKAPKVVSNENNGAPSKGSITYVDVNNVEKTVSFDDSNLLKSRSSASDDIVIDLGSQVAVKEISINVTGNRGNKNISEIAKIEFLNNVYKELPKPVMSIPNIKTVETSTNLHDERITLTWEPQANVTAYEVKYEKLDDKGNVIKTKKLQTNTNSLNILDKDIKPYDLYRVSIQSLNGDWQSGYEFETGGEGTTGNLAFDGKADNVDVNFNPNEEYYNGDKGTVSEIQVIPIQAPQKPINLITSQGYRSFSVSWEQHIQARDFDIYYRKIGDENKKWKKANEDNIEVDENSLQVTNPDKSKLSRAHSYTVNGLEDKSSYEIRVTATNHLGTSEMSKTYIASTEDLEAPVSSNYKLINKPTNEGEIGTSNIIDVENTTSSGSVLDSKYAVVDNDYSTTWILHDWDSGIYSDRGPTITFDKEYTMDTITIVPTLQKGNFTPPDQIEIHSWLEDGTKTTLSTRNISWTTSNGREYATVKLDKPIVSKKIQVNPSVYSTNKVSISEIKFYEYDSLENDVKALYEDDLRLVIKNDVTQEKIDTLVTRANTKDIVSDEYHPNKTNILKELDVAQKLFNDQNVSEKIVGLDVSIRNDNIGPSLGMSNDWQSLGAVARPGKGENQSDKKIVVYMGSNDPNAQVEITFLQQFGLPSQYQAGTTIIKPGRTEITIPKIISANVEKGGAVMAKVRQGKADATIKLRLSGTTDIPHLNVNNIINDTSKIQESKDSIRAYLKELKKYVNELPSMYPSKVEDKDKIDNIYLYDEQTSVLNSTDIEGDRFTLTVPATQILNGIKSGLNDSEDAEVDRVYDALLAWEQEIKVAYSKKGVYEVVQDFNGNGAIDREDEEYFNKHKAPLNRMNMKYQRMVMGAAAYASAHHVGVGYGTVSEFMQGVPYKFDENKNLINADSAKLYGTLIGHEVGHVMDIADRLYPETSNNLLAALTETMQNEDSPLTTGAMSNLYKKVTSNTSGLSTNRSVVLGMLWQPYLAYENEITYKMLFNDSDADMSNDSYYAKLNRAYRDMTTEEKVDADRDQLLIRMTSKVVGKDLSGFYYAHGITANTTTLKYVSQFPKEDRPIQYINDEARRMRIQGTAVMAADTKLSASFGSDKNGTKITSDSYVNQKEVPVILSTDKDDDKILGYEIYRNGKPAGFILRDKDNEETTYTDIIDSINNRVFEYKAVAYDYDLNKTNEVDLGQIKVRHDGGVAKSSMELKTNTVDKDESNNDIHGSDPNKGLAKALDNDNNTLYEGRKLTKDEYNSSIHGDEMNPKNDPYVIMDVKEAKSLVGIKYTAPTSSTLFNRTKLSKSAINKYKVEVSLDGVNWINVNEGTFKADKNNPTETIYFNKDGVEGGKQLHSYNARYVKLTAKGATEVSIAELEVITPPGDNIEIGVAEDNINYNNGLGVLKESFIYQVDNVDTPDVNEQKVIPKGSIIITGEYRGNPAFNVPLVLNQNEEHIAEKYKGILMAEIPNNGDLEEISEGNWVYWVEPQDAAGFMVDNKSIFAELYRTDTADASDNGQRLVSDTFKMLVPDTLPEISLNTGVNKRSENNIKVVEIDEKLINNVIENR